MATTITTANYTSYNLAHNIRDKELIRIENEKWAERHPGEIRIHPDGDYEILHYEKRRAAYAKLFSAAVAEWNQKQIDHRTPDRCISDYYDKIKKSEKDHRNAKHSAYEMIYTIGNMDNPIDPELSKTILKEVYEGFRERNPNLYVACAVIHNDETGVPHMHLTYIPVAYNCTRGLRTQVSLAKALSQQGIESVSMHDTAQMRWQDSENRNLEGICIRHGLEIVHPQRGKGVEHLDLESYRLSKEIERANEELGSIQRLPLDKVVIKSGRLQQLEEHEKLYIEYRDNIDQIKRDKRQIENSLRTYAEGYEKLQQEKADFESVVNKLANEKVRRFKELVEGFLQEFKLLDKFRDYLKQRTEKLSIHL